MQLFINQHKINNTKSITLKKTIFSLLKIYIFFQEIFDKYNQANKFVMNFKTYIYFHYIYFNFYSLVLEYVGPSWRTFVANMSIAIFFTFGACVLPWMAYFINNWRLLAIATSVPMLLVILAPFTVPESAR